MILKTEAIVLKTFDLRETSKIAVFFSKNHGKVKGVLKGVRKDPKKFGSSVDKFSVNDIVYYTHRNSELHLISQCDLKTFFFPVRSDIKKNTAAHYIIELTDAMMPLEEANTNVYNLVIDSLTSLETVADTSKLIHVFQIKMLNLTGFKPHIDSCLACEKVITQRARFSMRMGGLVCEDCKRSDSTAQPISKGTIATLLYIERNNWANSLKLGLTKVVQKELKYTLNNFLVFHLEKQMKTTRFL